MRKLILAGALTLALPACTPGQLDDTFATVCSTVPVADLAFQYYVSQRTVSQQVIVTERNAVAAAQAICSGPRPQDVATSIKAVQRAIQAIVDATKAAQMQQAGAQ